MAVKLSVVMPAYNEEQLVEQAIREVIDNVFGLVESSELVVVDDGSTDDTALLLDKLSRLDRRIRILHRAHGGHGQALMAGLELARGESFLLLDSDCQIPLEIFQEAW